MMSKETTWEQRMSVAARERIKALADREFKEYQAEVDARVDKVVPPDTSAEQILADWFGEEWENLTESNRECVIAELSMALNPRAG